MAEIKFMDYTENVQKMMADLAEAVLEEVAGELESQVKRNTPVGKANGSGLKNSWEHRVYQHGEGYIAEVGSPLERAIWVEFGTGEYALNGDGRKGGWYIPVGSGKGEISEAVVKAYGMKTRSGKNGKEFVFTKGMKPQRPFWKAYTSKKNKLIKRMQSRFKGGLS